MEQFNLCNHCAYAPCFCGNEPENCVAYVQRNGIQIVEKEKEKGGASNEGN